MIGTAMLAWAVTAVCLLIVPAGVPSRWGLIGTFAVPVAGASRVSQIFSIEAGGLDTVSFEVDLARSRVSRFQVELFDLDVNVGGLVRAADLATPRAVDSGVITWRFPPISESKGRRYRLDVKAATAAEGHALFVRAVKGLTGNRGLYINNMPRWADVVFWTDATAALPWRSVLLLSSRHPSGVNGAAALSAWAAALVLLLVFLLSASLARRDDAAILRSAREVR